MSTKRALSWLQNGWTAFVDPDREQRLERNASAVHKLLVEQRAEFRYQTAADRLDIDAEERAEVARRLFGRCAVKAWNDGDLTDKEHRSLVWIGESLELSPDQITATMREHAVAAFSNAMAAAFADGVLTDSEYAQLERIAKACGESAESFFRNQFRNDGEGFIRQLFLRVWEDGQMDEGEWSAIRSATKRLGMDDTEFREAIRAPAQQLVEHFLADYKSDEEITADERSTLEWMLRYLIDDPEFSTYVRDEIDKVVDLSAIRRGVLPSLTPPANLAIRSGEIVHYVSPATYAYLRKQRGELVTDYLQGTAVVTDYRLMFVSPTQSMQVVHNGILGFHPKRHGLEIQTAGKGAGRYSFDHKADFGTEIWVAAIRRANQTLVTPVDKSDARKIPRDVRQRIWQRYGGRCAECSATNYLEFDHIIPVARGGGNGENNIQLLCRGCNSQKSDKI